MSAQVRYRQAIREHARSAGWTLPPEPRLLFLSRAGAVGWLLVSIGTFLSGHPWWAVLMASPLLYYLHRMVSREAKGLDEFRDRHGFEGKRSGFRGEIDGRAFEYGAHSEESRFRDSVTGNYRVTDTAGMRLLLRHPTRHSLSLGSDGRLVTSLDLGSESARELEDRVAIYGPGARLAVVDAQVLCFDKGLYENAADLEPCPPALARSREPARGAVGTIGSTHGMIV